MSEKVEAKGGNGGQEWDDGANHDDVTKIYVATGRKGIRYVKFDYAKSGSLIAGSIHGMEDDVAAVPTEFVIDQPDEYIESVEGRYDNRGIIQRLVFKTNKKTSLLVGFSDASDTEFSLGVKDKKIVGFHGYAENYLHSLGAYFVPRPLPPPVATKSGLVGGGGGNAWDHGVFDGVRKVCVGNTAGEYMSHLKVEYQKGDKVETLQFGEDTRKHFREVLFHFCSVGKFYICMLCGRSVIVFLNN